MNMEHTDLYLQKHSAQNIYLNLKNNFNHRNYYGCWLQSLELWVLGIKVIDLSDTLRFGDFEMNMESCVPPLNDLRPNLQKGSDKK